MRNVEDEMGVQGDVKIPDSFGFGEMVQEAAKPLGILRRPGNEQRPVWMAEIVLDVYYEQVISCHTGHSLHHDFHTSRRGCK
jgi:hypothetical protein